MGQRHQVFLIARITPHGEPPGQTKYRCIAALHHQDCYGRMPLRAATRFFTLIKQKENAEIVREEIQSIHGLYGTFRTFESPELPDIPCPFVNFLMQSALSSDLRFSEDCYGSDSCCTLRASMGTQEGDNNDGITVIDVTDPDSPAYCFVFLYDLQGEDLDTSIMTPLSATEYVRVYYPELEPPYVDEELEQEVLNTLRPFESVPMITIDMLAEAWPEEYAFHKPNFSEFLFEPKESSPTVQVLPSLVELAFLPALNRVLETGETDCLDPFMWIPGNVSKIKETLRACNPLSAIGFALLSKVIPGNAKSIDLSHFTMTIDQLIELLSTREGVEVLNLSHMPQIPANILQKLIPMLPNLRRLVLLHTIPDTDFLSLLSESPELFYRIESLIHLAFLRPPGEAAFPAVFSHSISRYYHRENDVVSLPYFTSDQLVQALTDCFSCLRVGTDGSLMFTHCGIPVMAMYASAVREPGRSWSERIVPFIPGLAPRRGEGWIFSLSHPPLVSHRIENPHFRYAFAKVNKGVLQKYQQGMSEPALLKTKFDIFDIRSLFQELVKEGRPAPSPKGLRKLLELFAALEKSDRLCIMTQADLQPFLKI